MTRRNYSPCFPDFFFIWPRQCSQMGWKLHHLHKNDWSRTILSSITVSILLHISPQYAYWALKRLAGEPLVALLRNVHCMIQFMNLLGGHRSRFYHEKTHCIIRSFHLVPHCNHVWPYRSPDSHHPPGVIHVELQILSFSLLCQSGTMRYTHIGFQCMSAGRNKASRLEYELRIWYFQRHLWA